ncbi:hypothetical protein H6P81_015762 [Aristolochia fimbriata]|uniref:acid phosphatase n=1 Tax=Aristolochia fimbriata TaxID=158543 RepID=A0AAV7E9K6_ARIFI|nr:hypothetical protein H6P81_015762 [Aristolochia fimbriata]
MGTAAQCRLSIANLQFCHRPHSLPSRQFVAVPILRVLLHPLAVPTFLKSSVASPSPINSALRVAASMASSAPSPAKPFSVLFVCLGNICRSPAAEGVFRGIVREKGMGSKFMIDSAGTIDYHEGNPADSRMKAAAKKRAIEITSISRPIKPSDFIDFDLILAMDNQNRADILGAYSRWKDKASLPADAYKKVKLMCSYCKKHEETEVPDPYYGGPQGFEKEKNLGTEDPKVNSNLSRPLQV